MEVVELTRKCIMRSRDPSLRKKRPHLFGLDQTMKEREALEMLPRTQPHGVEIYFATNPSIRMDHSESDEADVRHLVKDLLAGSLPITLAFLRVGVYIFVKELPDDLLKRLVVLIYTTTGHLTISERPKESLKQTGNPARDGTRRIAPPHPAPGGRARGAGSK